jgi:hypothetical protein
VLCPENNSGQAGLSWREIVLGEAEARGETSAKLMVTSYSRKMLFIIPPGPRRVRQDLPFSLSLPGSCSWAFGSAMNHEKFLMVVLLTLNLKL